ncbi:unnamed protein product [Rhizoctonia solani]|uniref:Uncharacterized protein n=1 Tax=Rhizoctonia solani TaxID=456999 RepID=A0A8H3DG54_9AGAM|nr:unnamed protein product [Rhizoctonia solani]
MSRPSASMSTTKGFFLTFDDLAAFTNHIISSHSPSTPVRDAPKMNEGRSPDYNRVAHAFQRDQRPRHRHSASSASSTSSWQPSSPPKSRSSVPPHARTGSRVPTSPKFVDHPPRRLTESERAALANYTEPEMDITDMVGVYRDQGMSFEPLR